MHTFKTKTVSILVGLVGLVSMSSAAGWDGEYRYERVYKNSQGASVGELYNVTLGPGKACRLVITGPASHEDIVCRAARTEKSVTVHFARFADSKAATLNKARAYPKDQTLFTLEERAIGKNPKAIRTISHKLRTLDGQRLRGASFQRAVK